MVEGESTVAPAAEQSVETVGGTVDEAIASGLRELGASADQVSVEVLARPSQALPGEHVSGSAEARVRVTRLDPHTLRGRAILTELLERMGIPARVTVRPAEMAPGGRAGPPVLDIGGDDLGLLIGWRGETLRALQTVVNLMMGEEEDPESSGRRIILDVERYRLRREEQVREMALRLANRVKRSGQRYMLDPMHAYERRAIHVALAEDAGVRTESIGHEPARRVVIHPTGPAQPDLPELPDRPGRPPGRGEGARREHRDGGRSGGRGRWSR